MDELKDMYNAQPSWLSSLADPYTVKRPASWAAYNELGGTGESGGDTDALRHLLAAATLSKRQGALSEMALNWHENPNIPQFLGGGYGQRESDRQMDLHNNALGLEIGRKAKTYDEALAMAKQAIKSGKAKINPPEPYKPVTKEVADHDKNVTFREWLDKYNSK